MTNLRRLWPHAVIVALLLFLGVVAQHKPVTEPYGMLGFDTYLQVQAARIQTFQDFLDTFRERLAGGNIDPQFYRPVQHLSIALDYALGGLEPRWYHASSLLAFLASGILLYVACIRLLGPSSFVAGGLAAAFYVLHFMHCNVVPVPARRSEQLCVTFLLAALAVLPASGKERFWPRILLAGLFVLLASGAKDIGVMGLGIVAMHQLFAVGLPLGRRVARAGWATLVCGLCTGLYLLNRTMVLDGLGGYPPILHDRRTYWDKLQEFWPTLVGDLLVPYRILPKSWLPSGWNHNGVAITMLGASVLIGIVILVIGFWVRSPAWRRSGRTAMLGIAWLTPTAVLMGLTPRYGPWYAIIPLAGLCLLLAAVLHIAWIGLKSPKLGLKCGGLVLLVFGVAVMAPSTRYSPFVVEYTEWDEVSRVVVKTIADLDRKMLAAQPGARVVPIAARPDFAKVTGRPKLQFLGTIQRKGVRAYAEMRYPKKLEQVTLVDLARFRPE